MHNLRAFLKFNVVTFLKKKLKLCQCVDAFVSVEYITLLECCDLPCDLVLYMFIFFCVTKRRLEESELGP